MNNSSAACEQNDLIICPPAFLFAWGVPTLILIISYLVKPPYITYIWIASLVWMGVACLLNASNCKRTHCFYTGPFYLLMAFITFLHGANLLGLGEYGWELIGFAAIFAGIAMWILTEKIPGKYRGA